MPDRSFLMTLIGLVAVLCTLEDTSAGEAEPLRIHPPYDTEFTSREHPAGHEDTLGDRLGRDFIAIRLATRERPWPHAYQGSGQSNEDWYGWRQPVLSPVSGTVTGINRNPNTNRPGRFGEPPASHIRLRMSDGTRVTVAHVREIEVEEGQTVNAGDRLARTGNNGHSFAPHIHIGAWRDDKPRQITVDLQALGELVDPPSLADMPDQ